MATPSNVVLTATTLGARASDAAASDTGVTTARESGTHRGGGWSHSVGEAQCRGAVALNSKYKPLPYYAKMHAHLFLPRRRRPER